MDLEKLTPAPWHITGFATVKDDGRETDDCYVLSDDHSWLFMMEENWDNAEFIALARAAFDVMMRRFEPDDWGVYAIKRAQAVRWFVRINPPRPWHASSTPSKREQAFRDAFPDGWPDPFTALVEADRWYKDNVEAT